MIKSVAKMLMGLRIMLLHTPLRALFHQGKLTARIGTVVELFTDFPDISKLVLTGSSISMGIVQDAFFRRSVDHVEVIVN